MTFNARPCWLVLLLAVVAAGCVSTDPVSLPPRAVDALTKGKLEGLRRQLAPEARSTLGTQQQMDAIRQKLAQYTKVSAGPPYMTASNEGDQGYGHHGVVLEVFESAISGSRVRGAPPEAIYKLLFKCQISYKEMHHDAIADTCSTTIDENGIPWTNCSGGTAAFDSIDLDESCSITGLSELQQDGAR